MHIQIWWENIFESGHLKNCGHKMFTLRWIKKNRKKLGNWVELVQDII